MDARWMRDALALAEHGRGRTAPAPHVGCILLKDGAVVGRGWTQPSGRPHAEAVALAEAGGAARGATAYVTLEPCAHKGRGPACAPTLAAAGIARVFVAIRDSDPRTAGRGLTLLRDAGVEVSTGVLADDARAAIAGFLSRVERGRPRVTLKLAQSIDGRIAMPSGESRWITGPEARERVHLERAHADAILVGRGTYEADAPKLDVRIDGLETQAPRRLLLTSRQAPHGWTALPSPAAIVGLHDVNDLLVEGGSTTAAAFLRADLVDRILIFTAPILLGAGVPAVADFGLAALAGAHARWRPTASERLGVDRLDTYERIRS